MQKFVIEGGIPLKGQVQISGAKNAAIKMVAASLLTGEEVVLENIPRIDDVGVIVEIVENLGVKKDFLDEHTLALRADEVFSSEVPHSLGVSSRSAIVTVGPLLARCGEATLPEPGGCRIGLRPIDRHLGALQLLGAEVKSGEGFYKLTAPRLRGADVHFAKNTVMGTENTILAAVLAEGETVLTNAAEEAEVDDLIELLIKMGAKVKRDENETRRIVIEGVRELKGARHRILPDRNEAVTFAVAAAATRGDVTLEDVRPLDLTAFTAKLEKMGVGFDIQKQSLRVWLDKTTILQPVEIETAPHPGFMTDWQQPTCVLLTQAVGESSLHETIYEDRFGYVKDLKKMGARIKLQTPSEAEINFDSSNYGFDWTSDEEPKAVAKIFGPTSLSGRKLQIPDLRAGAALVLAALAAKGQSEISGVEHIDRGYEKFDEKLRNLGAKIERVME
jgi:UDP-N-acetylglucosamine 1-carboxyvinyltransferase